MTKENIIQALGLSLSKENLINLIEFYVHKEDMGYAEAIIHLCTEREYDPEDIAPLITGALKDKLRLEAEKNHMIKASKNNTATLL